MKGNLGRVFFDLGFLFLPFLSIRFLEITLSDVLFFLAFLTTFFKASAFRTVSFSSTYKVAMFLILIFGMISSTRAISPLSSLSVLIRFVFILYLLLWLMQYHWRSFEEAKKSIRFLGTGLGIFSVLLLLQSFQSKAYFSESLNVRSAGFAEHYTDAGGVTALALSLVLGKLWNVGIYRIPVIALLTLATALTGSVSAYIAVSIAALSTVFNGSTKKVTALLTTATIILTFIVIQLYNVFNLQQRIASATTGRYSTLESRQFLLTESWRIATANAGNFFLGKGLDFESGIIASLSGLPLQSHNVIMQLLVQGGFFFLLGFIFIWITAIKRVKKFPFHIRIAISTPMLCLGAFAMTSPLMYSRYVWLPFLLALGIRFIDDKSEVS